jgi:hypothetical protein
LFFDQTAGAQTLDTAGAETTVATISAPVTVGQEIKIDHALGIETVVTSNWSINLHLRIYRDSTLIHTRSFNRTATTAGTQRFDFADTYVDTAPAEVTSTYDLRVIFTTATNVTSATAFGTDMNLLVF